MSLFKTPKSILDIDYPAHGRHLDSTPAFEPVVNSSEAALHRTLATAADHHEAQFAATAIASGVVVPEDCDADFPRHVHSTTKEGEYMIARDEDHHTELVNSGEWSETPCEVTLKEKE